MTTPGQSIQEGGGGGCGVGGGGGGRGEIGNSQWLELVLSIPRFICWTLAKVYRSVMRGHTRTFPHLWLCVEESHEECYV